MSFEAVHSTIQPTSIPTGAEQVNAVEKDVFKNAAKKSPLNGLFIQHKLTVGAPDDPYEKEADAVADKVMRMPACAFVEHKTTGSGPLNLQRNNEDEEEPLQMTRTVGDNFIQKKCADCELEEEKIHRKPLFEGITPVLTGQPRGLQKEENRQKKLHKSMLKISPKLAIGAPDDPLEKEADDTAAIVLRMPENSFIQRKCAACDEKEKVQKKPLVDGITAFIQRKEIKDREVQPKEFKEDLVQLKWFQRKEVEEEETFHARRIQRKEIEEEEPVQTKLIQSKEVEEEEPVQARRVQRKESEDEEPVQPKRIQRKENEEEEPVQLKRIQRKENEEEEPVQLKRIQRKENEEEDTVQAKALSKESSSSIIAIDGQLQDAKGKGSRLSSPVLKDMEAGFGVDLKEVRIHTNQVAVEMNQALHAQAFTHGWDVFFNMHKYNPNTSEGKFLLAHELTHTIQQAKANGETLMPALTRIEPEIPIVPDEVHALEAAQQEAEAEAIDLKENPSELEIESTLPNEGSSQPPPKKPQPKKSITLPPCKPSAKKKGKVAVTDNAKSAPSAPSAKPEAESTSVPAPQPQSQESQVAMVEQAPKCPGKDPAFNKVKSLVTKDAKKQANHEPASKKRGELVDSAALPISEQNLQSGQEQQAENLEKAASPKPFDRLEFKRKLREKIESKMPENEDQAKAFAGSNKLNEAKEEFKSTISEEKVKVSGPLEQTAAQSLPDGQNIKPDNIAVPNAKLGDKPTKVPPGLASPKPRTEEEISLAHKSVELDEQMANEGLSEQQLAESEEPKFEQALQSKKNAQREIAAAPGIYRQVEGQQLEKSSKQADSKTRNELLQMASTKTGKNGEVFVGQIVKETETEKRQREIKEKIDGIYTQTKTDVEKILTDLSLTVETEFTTQVEIANETFKSRVHSRLDDHYGYFTFDDKIAEWAGLSDGVAHIFKQEKELFLSTMDIVLNNIASTVETELNKALARIQLGRTELGNFKKTLSVDELKFADDLFLEAEEKFRELESSVNESQDELIETLSDAYVENVNKLQEEFDKIDEELSASWIADAFSFIGEVATAIKKLGELLSSIASRIGQYISDILASPKRFFNNLVEGIKGGMDDFSSKIDTYLEQGFWMWLTGASSKNKIEIPQTMNTEGMFKLAAQILGITKEFILQRIEKIYRISVNTFLSYMEKADSVAMKVMEPVKILLTQGIGALWGWVQGEISSKLEEIFGGLKIEIFQAIIKKFLLWVAQLFIPGLGFIKLIQAAYKALRWLVDNIDRIVEIVNSLLDAVGLAVQGNVSAIRKNVVRALTNGVVIAIDFLAKLVGLGNFGDKLQRGIQKLQKPVHGAIDFILKKARPFVNKIKRAVKKGAKAVKRGIGAVKQKGKQALDFVIDWWKAEKKFSGKDGKLHRLFFQGKDKKATLMVESVTTSFERFVENVNTNGNLEKEVAKKQALPIAALVDKEKVKFPPKGLSGDALKKFFIDRKQTVNKLLNDLSVPVSVLMDGKELPKGTYDQPIPLRWTKRGLVNDLYNLVPIAKRWESKKMTPPMPIAQANFRKKTWLEIPPTMEEKFPTEETQVSEGRSGRFIQIGVDEKFFPKIGKRLERTAGRSDSVKNRFRNTLLPNYGLSFKNSGYDMDHVQDMGMGGKDSIPNLWPLYEGMNRKYGTMIYDQVVSYLGDDNKPKLSTPKALIGKWFVIESIGDAETG